MENVLLVQLWEKLDQIDRRLETIEQKLQDPTPADTSYLTVSEMAKQLRIGLSKAYELLQQNLIPHQRIGRSYRIPAAAIHQFERGQKNGQIQSTHTVLQQGREIGPGRYHHTGRLKQTRVGQMGK